MQLFYAADLSQSYTELTEDEAFHAVKVLRLKAGDAIHLTDGMGHLAHGEILTPSAKGCVVEVKALLRTTAEPEFGIDIAIAPTKSIERFEWFVEKAVETGVRRIYPLRSRYSERKVLKSERLQKILIAAGKQSNRLWFAKMSDIQDITSFLAEPREGRLAVAHCGPGDRVPLKRFIVPGQSATILIGPEGDFSPDEIVLAQENGYCAVSLGENRLRTETAGIVACHTFMLLND